uniref:Uncharacterized protein n=1 Tax=Arundo donax TaxID=35708 RepID=A0A0A8ZXK8_ARUDO
MLVCWYNLWVRVICYGLTTA